MNVYFLKKSVKLLWLAFFLFLIVFIVSRLIKIAPTYLSSSQYRHSLAEGILFGKHGLPTFIENIEGFSGEEPWGRWTDATKSTSAKIKFRVSLPQSFTMILNAKAFGPNENDPVIVRVTSSDPLAPVVEKQILLKSLSSEHQIDFSIKSFPNINTIEIIPPHPISPNALNHENNDFRLIGVGVSSIKIINNPNTKNAK